MDRQVQKKDATGNLQEYGMNVPEYGTIQA
jgi:hypothetical protein